MTHVLSTPLPTDKEERVGNVSLVIWILPKGLKNDSGWRYLRLGLERTMYEGLDFLIHRSFQICYFPAVVYPGCWFRKFVTMEGLRQSPGVPHMGRAQWCPQECVDSSSVPNFYSLRSDWCLFNISSARTSSFIFSVFSLLSPSFSSVLPNFSHHQRGANSLFLPPNYFWFHSQIWPIWGKIQTD